MNFDMSFILGSSSHTEPPSKPTEPRQGQEGRTTPPTTTAPERATQSLTAAEQLETAREIIARHKISREITEGVMLQLERDLKAGKDNLPTLILFLTEALDRVSGGGDQYIKRAEQALRESGHIV